MKRMVSFGLVLAFIICIILVPGCAQHHVTPSPEEEERTVTLAGGAADPQQESQDQAPEGEDSSADAGQAPETQEPENTGDLTILSQPRTQQYGTCSNYTQLDGQVTLRLNHPTGRRSDRARPRYLRCSARAVSR